MKSFRYVLIPLLIVCALLAGCAGKTTPEPAGEPDIEKAMDIFLTKLDQGNYTMEAPNYLRTDVFSEDLITFTYTEECIADFVIMSVNDESFRAGVS